MGGTMKIKSALLGLAALVLAAGGACAQTPKSGGVLRVLHRDNPPSASIAEEATISTVMPFMAVFNNLVVFDPASEQNRPDRIVPELATAWHWDSAGKALTFTLRDGVTWHDGEKFTSADVKCTWDMLIGKSEAKLRKNPRKSWYWNIQEVTTNGDQEVTFHLTDPQPSFLVLLAGGFSPVYPCHVPAAQMRTHPIGTGPFMFSEFKQNESIKLVRNPHYWKPGKPYLDGIEYTIVPDPSTAMLAFVAGRFDLTFTGDMSPKLTKELQTQDPKAICRILPSNTQADLLVVRDKPPFDDPRIRRALGLALDRKAFVDLLGDGYNQIGGAMLPQPNGLWGMSPAFLQTVAGYAPDVEKSREEARALMRQAGYGPDKPLQLKVSTRNLQVYRDPAVILIDQLKTIYIQGELEVLEASVWYARMARKDYAIALNVQGVGTDDPDVVFFETFACGSERNYTSYCNTDMEKLFHKQSQMTDFTQRRQAVWEIDKALQEDGARPVIYHNWAGTCWQPDVKGVNMAVNTIYNHWRFEDVWLDK
jgi:peptide/nickel transport system substrate-binding protein